MKNNIIYILAALVIGVVIGIYLPKDGNSFTKDGIQKVINESLLQGQVESKVKEIVPKGNISEVKLEIQGQGDAVYVNSNGKVFYQKIADLEEIEVAKKEAEKAQTVQNKTDKPEVELFVMSYCPYGTQTEKGYLPAVEKLGDSINAKVKFVNYVMHPSQGEGEENLLQYCIQETQPEKFNTYLACFLEKGDTENCLAKTKINKTKVDTCISEIDKKYSVSKNLKDKNGWINGRYPRFLVQDDLNKKYGVQGSPTLVINGQKVQTGRDANSIFKAICSAFKNPPKICEEELDKTAPAPGFGYDNSGANSSEGGCGA